MTSAIRQRLLLLVCISFFINNSYALTSDRLEPIQFKAGHVTFNETTGKGVYTEGVSIHQGTSHLNAYRAITNMNKKHQLTLAIAFGSNDNKAHFWTLTTQDKPALHAYADTIYYHPCKHQLELIGHAEIIQGNNQLTAPHMLYDTKAERLITTAENHARTTILIDPTQYPEKQL
ncbi:MAG: lipopolysaccharide transport periplasmic protein LptA [Gammaproteobacteria bacterium]|nr:lipopolysaccharide transport periplasmic protein LptA [Gammaproteobacteria bacterium]MCH9762752.1 lipopolysaccharide transport periplasmic protein LptA [Gammaproteobacteria bacterium]